MNIVKAIIRIVFILIFPIVVAAATYVLLTQALLGPLDPSNNNKVIVEIAPGMSFGQIAQALTDKSIVKYRWSLELLARFKKTDTRIKAGEYEFTPAMTPKEVLAKLMAGDMVQRQVIIREGVSVSEIGSLLEKAGVIFKTDFDKAVADPTLLAKAGIEPKGYEGFTTTFEGYLFPDTYFFSRPINSEQVIWRMLEEGEKHWKPEYTERADQLRLSRHEILTLASIIEKESGNPDEQPIVSSVFHNRLAQGMKLQSDPTVIYGIKNFNGNLTKDDLQTPSPYNTYVNFGLPPGPITNPGATAIRAALFPAETAYLYFVSNGGGTHIFSSTLAEHNAAVAKYQKKLLNEYAAPPPPAPKMGVTTPQQATK